MGEGVWGPVYEYWSAGVHSVLSRAGIPPWPGTWETHHCWNHTRTASPPCVRAWSWASSGRSDVLPFGGPGPVGQWRGTPAGVCDSLPGSPAQGRLLLTPGVGQGRIPLPPTPPPCLLGLLPGTSASWAACQHQAWFVSRKGLSQSKDKGQLRPSPSPRRHWADGVRSHFVPASPRQRAFFFCLIHSPFHSFLPPSARLSLTSPLLT